MKIDFDVNKTEKMINTKMSLSFRKIALDGMARLVKESPTDTARFKANWSTTIGVITSEVIDEPAAKTPKGQLTSAADFRKSSENIAKYKLGQTMFLHNNLEYALPLEFGHSGQAPSGWIRATANAMQKKLDQIKDIL